jgi:hypothetical protein
MEPLQEEMPAERILKLIMEREEEPWFSTDMAALLRSWNEPSKYRLGAKACKVPGLLGKDVRRTENDGDGHVDILEGSGGITKEVEDKEEDARTADECGGKGGVQEIIGRGLVAGDSTQYIVPTGRLCESRIHVVAKKPGKDGKRKWRLVVNNIGVNAEQVTVHFRMEGAHTVQQVALPGVWSTSIDLKSAFNHLRVHKEMIPFLCFAFEG